MVSFQQVWMPGYLHDIIEDYLGSQLNFDRQLEQGENKPRHTVEVDAGLRRK